MASSNLILMTGATGYIGQHLVNRLLAEGAAVRVLTRGTRPLPDRWAGKVETALGDLVDPTTLPPAIAGCKSVYHLAGELRDPARMQDTNVRGTQHLLAACKQAETVERVVLLSSVGVMGVRKPGLVDEMAPCRPQNVYEQSKYTAEQLALSWSAQTHIPVTALRPTIVFGDGPRVAADSVLAWLRAIQSGRFVFFDKQAVANYVYVGDVATACLRSAEAEVAGVYIVADPCPLTGFVTAAAEALGVPAPSRAVPLPIAQAFAFVLQAFGRLLRKNPPLTIARVQALSNRTCYDSTRIKAALGWQPAIGYRDGLQRTVNWYRQIGQLA